MNVEKIGEINRERIILDGFIGGDVQALSIKKGNGFRRLFEQERRRRDWRDRNDRNALLDLTYRGSEKRAKRLGYCAQRNAAWS